MPLPVTSRHLIGATELTLIADIKSGLVEIPEPTAYSARLRLLLETFFDLRSAAIEREGLIGLAGPLELLRSLQRIHWSIHDNDSKLLLAVSFDGPWEPYLRDIVEKAGPLLDIIFCHCSGYAPGHTCFEGYPQFSQWVRERQQRCEFFYTGSPDLTVDDVRYLQQFERAHAATHAGDPPFDVSAARTRVTDPLRARDREMADELLARAWKRHDTVAQALARLGKLFPNANPRTPTDDHSLFMRAATLMTQDIRPGQPRPEGLAAKPQMAALRPFDNALAAAPEKCAPVVVPLREPETLQANILRGYDRMTHGRLLLVQFDLSRGGEALENLASAVTTAAREKSDDVKMNVALTFDGLSAVGLPREVLARFPKEFQEGMATRAGLLGDVVSNHPDNWTLPRRNWLERGQRVEDEIQLSTVHAVVVLQTSDPEVAAGRPDGGAAGKIERLLNDKIGELEKMGLFVLHSQSLLRKYEQKKVLTHFDLVDGLSQPFARLERRESDGHDVALGDLLLGYSNERGEAGPPLPAELLHNSTFLVVRKLEQDVKAFDAHFENMPNRQTVLSKLLGRAPEGEPLIADAKGNEFDYSSDPKGEKCPFFSHIRRSNPRESHEAYARLDRDPEGEGEPLGDPSGRVEASPRVDVRTPRIMRRGFSYGRHLDDPSASANEERGLMFMAYSASIADQFEVIQRWVNGGNSAGGLSSHPDLLAGNFLPSLGPERRQLSYLDDSQVEHVPYPAKPFVSLKWGLYLFAPSTKALHYLASQARPASRAVADPQALRTGAELVSALEDMARHDVEMARTEWKRLLEDRDMRPNARAVWAYVRSEGGVLRTPYGVLVGSENGVAEVLSNDDVYSVRKYWDRMEKAFGGHYLGEDRDPATLQGRPYPVRPGDYDQHSVKANQYLHDISALEMYREARAFALKWYAQQPAPDQGERKTAEMSALARHVVAKIATKRFGLPDGNLMQSGDELEGTQTPAQCPVDFQRVSQYVFHPNPSTTLKRVGRARGNVVREVVNAVLKSNKSDFSRVIDGFIAQMDPAPNDPEVLRQQLIIGTINGFVVPTSASFLSVMVQWIESRDLWRWRDWWRGNPGRELREILTRPGAEVRETALLGSPLLAAITQAMTNLSVPDLLHRTAVKDHRLRSSRADIRPGDRVVISLSSAASEAGNVSLLFGGNRNPKLGPDEQKPVHACPGQRMALGVLLGTITATFEQFNLRRKGKTILSFDDPPTRPSEPPSK